MRYVWILCLLILTSCGNNYNRPRRLYVDQFIGTTAAIEAVVADAKDTINQEVGYNLLNYFGVGDKPITIKMVDPDDVGEDVFAHARYLEYHCLVQIRSDLEQMVRENINPTHPSWVSDATWKDAASKIIMHELGHCAGFVHSKNAQDLMYESFQPSWDASSVYNFVKDFEKANY